MFLLVDKPKGMTSHDVVERIRRETGEKRVGHGGTLDPNATGLLIIGVGRESTKKLGEIAKGMRKEYEAEIFLGEERDSDDAEGEILNRVQNDGGDVDSLPVLSKVRGVLKGFIGEQEQVPPVYSAVKIKGREAYKLARRGEKVELKPRKITVYKLELVDYEYPRLRIKCEVSSGTYIRALARDIGRALGCGAYLKNLRRTRIGKYRIEEAVKMKNLIDLISN